MQAVGNEASACSPGAIGNNFILINAMQNYFITVFSVSQVLCQSNFRTLKIGQIKLEFS